ncbi:hypothetical protein LX36DRAFT_79193 [Colletotrichum falcatum]|nr:hypothetical protein LX36DRAFT_79193 [Colletotrichum falcatum]
MKPAMDQGTPTQGTSSGLNSGGDLYQRGDEMVVAWPAEKPHAGAWHDICRQPGSQPSIQAIAHAYFFLRATDPISSWQAEALVASSRTVLWQADGRSPSTRPSCVLFGFPCLRLRLWLSSSSGLRGAARPIAPRPALAISRCILWVRWPAQHCRGALESAWVGWQVGHDIVLAHVLPLPGSTNEVREHFAILVPWSVHSGRRYSGSDSDSCIAGWDERALLFVAHPHANSACSSVS